MQADSFIEPDHLTIAEAGVVLEDSDRRIQYQARTVVIRLLRLIQDSFLFPEQRKAPFLILQQWLNELPVIDQLLLCGESYLHSPDEFLRAVLAVIDATPDEFFPLCRRVLSVCTQRLHFERENHPFDESHVPLMLALRYGHLKTVRQLLHQTNADIFYEVTPNQSHDTYFPYNLNQSWVEIERQLSQSVFTDLILWGDVTFIEEFLEIAYGRAKHPIQVHYLLQVAFYKQIFTFDDEQPQPIRLEVAQFLVRHFREHLPEEEFIKTVKQFLYGCGVNMAEACAVLDVPELCLEDLEEILDALSEHEYPEFQELENIYEDDSAKVLLRLLQTPWVPNGGPRVFDAIPMRNDTSVVLQAGPAL